MEIKIVISPDGLEELQSYDPTMTIILGGDTELYKSCGFYYSFSSLDEEKANEFANQILALGVSESYELHKAMYNEEIIRSGKAKYGDTASSLFALLKAFKDNDYRTIEDIITYGLDSMYENVKNLTTIMQTTEGDSTWEIKYQRLKKEHQKLVISYNNAAMELSNLRKLPDPSADKALLQDRVEELQDKNAELVKKLSDVSIKLGNAVTKEKYDEAMSRLDIAEVQVKELVKQLKEHSTVAKETSEFIDTADKDIIRTLRERIEELEQSGGKSIDEMLPIIDDRFVLNAKSNNIIYIKDIKTVSFVGTLIEYFKVRVRSANRAGKPAILIIYDNLNGLSTVKYKKYGYSVNEADLDSTNPIIVTNNLTKNFLRDELNISSYELVIIIDRLGTPKFVLDRKDVKPLYLINTPNDITDYSLDPKRCIAYYDSNGECFADVIPSSDYAFFDKKTRMAKLVSESKFNKLFKFE